MRDKSRIRSINPNASHVEVVNAVEQGAPLSRLDTGEAKEAHFTDSQDKQDGHRAVSKDWAAECITLDQAATELEAAAATRVDLTGPLGDYTSDCLGGQLVIGNKKTGQQFRPTDHALQQLASMGGEMIDGGILRKLAKGDEADQRLASHLLRNSTFREDRTDQSKDKQWRANKDGTLRAVLSDQYRPVDNAWVLRLFTELLDNRSDVLVSHWSTDGDGLNCNLLLADSIRSESDSDYGGGLSIGNSEIGMQRCISMPWLFRAICMNGCIWGAVEGQYVKQVHRGDFSLADLRADIVTNFNAQLPVVTDGMQRALDMMAAARILKVTEATTAQVAAQLCKENRLTRVDGGEFAAAWITEQAIAGDGGSLFSAAQGLTRWGQTAGAATRCRMDSVAGAMFADQGRWYRSQAAAAALTDRQVVKAIGRQAVAALSA